MIKFGVAGLGSIDEAVSNLERYHKLGIGACEISFTYRVYIKDNEAEVIRKAAEKFNIQLSIHAPYWINLNSKEREKVEKSKKRILDCCRIGELLGAYRVVFHPGFYGLTKKVLTDEDKENVYQSILKEVLEIQKEIKKNKWKIQIAPETTGKINVFGSVDEIKRLVKDSGCSFCIDFAHLFARSLGEMGYGEMYESVKEFDELHCHFSGIEYGAKGERNHKITPDREIERLLRVLPKNKKIVIINESPDTVGDAVKSLKIYEGM